MEAARFSASSDHATSDADGGKLADGCNAVLPPGYLCNRPVY
jgi:hypothetical protein